MWKNNLKVAIRTLLKDKTYSAISILGLSVGLAFCLLMTMYLKNEWSYDRHHKQEHNVYRLVFDNYDNLGNYATTPLPIGPALQEEYPEVEAMTRVSVGFQSLVRFNNNKFFERVAFVDTGLVDVFHMDFIAGDPATALSQPNQIILSESAAKKYFGDGNPIGRELEIGSSGSLNSRVTAVFRDFPHNTHIRFDMAVPFSTFEKVYGPPNLWQQMPSNYTYFRLIEGQSGADFAAKLPGFADRHVGEKLDNLSQTYNMAIQPVSDIHLHSHLQREFEPNAKISSLFLLASIALLILLIANINYVNYATARFSRRAREVGIRKVIGAGRRQLIGQFLLETFVLALIAGLMALLLAQVLLPTFNRISGKAFQLADLSQLTIYGTTGLLIVLITFGAGIFPALFLSNFKIIQVLKGKSFGLSLPNLSRRYLVVVQFTASIVLLVATMVVYSQMQFAQRQFRSDDQHQVVVFQINSKINEKFEVVKEAMLKLPGVVNMSAGSNIPTFYGDSWPLRTELHSTPVQTENYTIENDFIPTFNYELIAGRDLDKERSEDVAAGFVLNETAVGKLGFASPDEALGQTLYWGSDNPKKGFVMGVVKDFHFQSLRDEVAPALFQFSPYEWLTNNFIAARIDTRQYATLQPAINQIITGVDPKWVADVRFLDDNFEKIHRNEIQQGRIFAAFALMSILISCLGLWGLAAFAAERRSKEVSIRKILGASLHDIVGLLSKDFLKLIGISLLIAVPLSYYLMNRWLQEFAYHIDIQWWMFVLAGGLTVGIAFLTVGTQGVKAALHNPVDSLSNE